MSTDTQAKKNAPLHREQRESLLHQKGCVLWFTGLSGAGKTTLACEVERQLHAAGALTGRLDGDVVRDGLNSDLGFSPEARAENIRRVTEVANIMTMSGVVVLVAAISPYSKDRAAARARLGDGRFFLIHVATPIEVCEARDPKGLYQKARAGEIPDFTGISAPYEAPPSPDLVVTTEKTLPETAATVLDFLKASGLLDRWSARTPKVKP